MKTIRKWWLRRRLLARLKMVRLQRHSLIAEKTTTLELLNEECRNLIRYRSYLQMYSARVTPTRNKVNALSIQLNMLGLQVDHHQRLEDQLQLELESL